MNTVPSTTSSPFCVAAPVRSSCPSPTVGDVARCGSARRRVDRSTIASSAVDVRRLARHAHQLLLRRCARCSRRRRSGCCSRQRIDHVVQREAISQQPRRIRRDVDLPHVAADRVDLGDARARCAAAAAPPSPGSCAGPSSVHGSPSGVAPPARPSTVYRKISPRPVAIGPSSGSMPGGSCDSPARCARRPAGARSRCRCRPRTPRSPATGRSATASACSPAAASPASAVSIGNVTRCSASSGE